MYVVSYRLYFLGHLCTCWWFDWSSSSYNFCPFGCYYCIVSCYCWVGYLPSCRSIGFHLPYHGPQRHWWWTLQCCSWSTKNLTRLQITPRYHCYLGYGWTFRRRQIDCRQSQENPEVLVPTFPSGWGLHWTSWKVGTSWRNNQSKLIFLICIYFNIIFLIVKIFNILIQF